MLYSLLLLIIAISVVISGPANTITTSFKSRDLLEKKSNPPGMGGWCPDNQYPLCCTGEPDRRKPGQPFDVKGCNSELVTDQGALDKCLKNSGQLYCCKLIFWEVGATLATGSFCMLSSDYAKIDVSQGSAQDSTSNSGDSQNVPEGGQDSAANQAPTLSGNTGGADMTNWIPAAGAAAGGMFKWVTGGGEAVQGN